MLETIKPNQSINKSVKSKKNTLNIIDKLDLPSTPRLAMKSASSTPRKNRMLDVKNEVVRKKQLFTPQVKRR